MKILHVSNIISHHQIPLARELAKIVGVDNFTFAATEPPSAERTQLGWGEQGDELWVIRAGESDAGKKRLEKCWDEADVVMCGERRFSRMQDRLDKRLLTFYMSERWWKPPIGIARLVHPRFALMASRFTRIAKSPFLHYLPMGDLAATDMRRIAAFEDRMWQWGYFTELPNSLPVELRDENRLDILWAGRMLAWKRVDTLIRAFSLLLHTQKHATLTLVGSGPEQDRLRAMAKQFLPEGSFRFLPPVPAAQVIELMKQHHIYVLPSNGYEGWGAVVNEAMSVGCAVIASSDAGAAKTMLRHGGNGFLFKPGDWQTLASHLLRLSQDKQMRRHLAENGQRTISESWSPTIAAKRFVNVSDALLSNASVPVFDDGPMMKLKFGCQ